MAEIINSSIGELYFAPQSAEDAVPSQPLAQLRWRGGDVIIDPQEDSESFLDGQLLQDAYTYRTGFNAGGAPVVQATPRVAAALHGLMLGQATVTTNEDGRGVHVFEDNNVGQPYSAWWARVGAAEGLNDAKLILNAKISQQQWEASADSRVLKGTVTFAGKTPSYWDDRAVPAPLYADTVNDPYLFTDVRGTLSVDDVAIGRCNQLSWALLQNIASWYDDDIESPELIMGNLRAELAGNLLVNGDSIKHFYKTVYGSETPAHGAKPTASVYRGKVSFKLSRGTGATEESIEIVYWNAYIRVSGLGSGNVDGSPLELSFTATAGRDPATGKGLTVTAVTADTVSYLAAL